MKLDDLTQTDIENIFEMYATHCYEQPGKDVLGRTYWPREHDATLPLSKKRGTKVLEYLAQSPHHGHEYSTGSRYSPHSKLVIDFNPRTKDIRVYFLDNFPHPKPAHKKNNFYQELAVTKKKFDKAVQDYFKNREHEITKENRPGNND